MAQRLVLVATVLLLIALWIWYYTDCTYNLSVSTFYNSSKKMIKLQLSSNQTEIIQHLKSLQFTLPRDCTQEETTIYNRSQLVFIIKIWSNLIQEEFALHIMELALKQVKSQMEKQLGLSGDFPELSREHLAKTFLLCITKM
ncbi:hypothetical protein XELAEV_18033565mg [Xenopus laevis]|uniref:Uncharacterized protein n=1 Tax=Xenopus laevis TaxID=8355 RepID=A0A974CL03_XENLA|nr:hypothetical protein XELAEV_18033565mg [Xenopus laevis]